MFGEDDAGDAADQRQRRLLSAFAHRKDSRGGKTVCDVELGHGEFAAEDIRFAAIIVQWLEARMGDRNPDCPAAKCRCVGIGNDNPDVLEPIGFFKPCTDTVRTLKRILGPQDVVAVGI